VIICNRTRQPTECYFQGWKMILPEGVEFVILGWGDKALRCQMLVWGMRNVANAFSAVAEKSPYVLKIPIADQKRAGRNSGLGLRPLGGLVGVGCRTRTLG
jgi:hypothetical protein